MEPDNTQSPELDPIAMQREMSRVLDNDPTLLSDIDKALGGPQQQPETPKIDSHGKLANLWNKMKEMRAKAHQQSAVEQFKEGFSDMGGHVRAAERGVLGAADQASDAIVGAGVGLSKATGVYKLGRTDEEQKNFLEWWAQPTSKANPLRFGEDRIRDWLGPASGGINSFVEGTAQFAAGFASVSKFLGLGSKLSLAQSAGVGAVTDLTFFDPHNARLSNLIQSGPEWIRNPVTAYLASKPDDTEAEGRLKSALEGSLIGATVDGLMHGIKAIKAAARGDTKGAIAAAEEAAKAAETTRPGDVATIQPTPDGKYAVVSLADKVKSAVGLSTDEIDKYAKMTGRSREEWLAEAAKHDEVMRDQEKRINYNRSANMQKFALEDAGKDMPVPEDAPVYSNRADAENAAVTLNVTAKNDELPKGTVHNDHVDAWKRALSELDTNGDPRSAQQILDQAGVNVNYVQSPEEVVNTVKALVQIAPDASAATRGRPRTWKEIAADADGMFAGMSGSQVVENAARVFGSTEKLDAHILAMRQWMWAHAAETRKLSRLATANPDNALATDQLAAALDTMEEFHAYLTGTSSNTARALNVHQMPVGEAMDVAAKEAPGELGEAEVKAQAEALGAESTGAVEGAEGAAKEATPKAQPLESHRAPSDRKITAGKTRAEIRALARAVFMADGDPSEILKTLRTPTMRVPKGVDPKKWWDYVIAYRMEAMLSGPKTQVTNTINNAIVMFQRPVEYWWAGVRSRNPALRDMGADMLGSLWENSRESWVAAKKSFSMGDNVLDPGNSHTGNSLKPWGEASWLQRIVRAPSRMLMSSDEFFKQMNYRANLRSQILRQARDEGISDAATLAKRLKEDMVFAFDPEGGAVNPLALQYARVGTFTNELEYGWGKSLQELTQKHALGRIIMPFVRTPVNIFRYAWERTPLLNRFNRQIAEDLAAGGERAAIARAKTEMGAALWTGGTMLVLTGQMTGAGPQDPELRRQLKETTGWQPYSIKIPGTKRWVSYRRGDPTMAPFGLIADIVSMAGEMHDEDFKNTASMALASIASNLSSKTFMQGVTDFMEAMSSGRADVVDALLSSTAGSFIPNALRQMNPDDTIRETRGFVEEMMARVPGFSTQLEARRNLFGDKILLAPGVVNRAFNPFTVSGKVDDVGVADDLIQLGRAFTMPAEKRGNIDLTDRSLFVNDKGQSPYDRMLELIGKPSNGMPSLKSRMEKLVQSDSYKKASSGDPVIQPGGMQWQLASNIVNAYQNYAWAQVMKEYPTLRTAMKQDIQLKGAALSKGSAGVDAVIGKYERMFVKAK